MPSMALSVSYDTYWWSTGGLETILRTDSGHVSTTQIAANHGRR